MGALKTFFPLFIKGARGDFLHTFKILKGIIIMTVNRRLGINGEYTERQDELRNMEMEKLNNRITVFSIVIICIVGLTLFFGYYYVRDNFTKVPMEIKTLSEDLIDEMDDISKHYSTLNQSLNSKMSILEKVSDALRQELKETQESVRNLKKNAIDKRWVEKTLEKVSLKTDTTLSEIHSNFKKQNNDFTNQLGSIDNKLLLLEKKFNTSINALQQDIEKHQISLKEASGYLENAVDHDDLEKTLIIEREEYEAMLAKQKALLEKRFEVLESRLLKTEKNLKTFQNRGSKNNSSSSENSGVKKSSKQKTIKTKTPKVPAKVPKQGDFFEQDITD
ncbi:hypothetical protein GMMP13_190008 [Candidatus Magnetomoraceae bacterium gMMP-13]